MAKQWETKPREYIGLEVFGKFGPRTTKYSLFKKKKKKGGVGSKTAFEALAFFSTPDVDILLLAF